MTSLGLDVLYGEADAAARRRFTTTSGCAACRDELAALRGLRGDLAAWPLPEARQRRAPRGFVVPRWLAAAALFVLGFGATLGASGYVSLRRAVAEQQARADALEALSASRSARSRPRSGRRAAVLRSWRSSTPASTSGCGRTRTKRESFERQLAAWQERSTCGAGPTWRRSRPA